MAYKFMKNDGSHIGTQLEIVYIRLLDNGYYGLCSEEEAQGVVVNGNPYHLEGRKELPNLETVSFTKITDNAYVKDLEYRVGALSREKDKLEHQKQNLLDIVSGEANLDDYINEEENAYEN